MEHALNTNIASQYDVNIALLLQHFKYWTLTNLANGRNLHDGLCWTYNTIHAFCEIFPYWTRHQIEHTIKKAEEKGLIVSGNYNEHKYDRTKWYALTPVAYQFYEDLQTHAFLERLYDCAIDDQKTHQSLNLLISDFSEMDFEIFRNVFRNFPRPIPDTLPNTKTHNNIGISFISDCGKKTEWEEFKNPQPGDYINLRYIELDDVIAEKEKSDYPNNHVVDQNSNNKLFKANQNSKSLIIIKSKLKNQSLRSKPSRFDLNSILNDNVYQIPEQMILDWLENRKKKRAPLTKTVWSSLCKQLKLCQENKINPIDAFEEMVSRAWVSLKAEWFIKNTHKNKSVAYYPTVAQRNADEMAARERELAWKREKEEEIAAAGRFKEIAATAAKHISLKERLGNPSWLR